MAAKKAKKPTSKKPAKAVKKVAKKAPAKKATTKKAPAKKVAAKKAPVKKVAAKKTPAKKVVAKKTPAKKVVAKKAVTKKVEKKATAPKAAPKKAEKTAAKKVAVEVLPAVTKVPAHAKSGGFDEDYNSDGADEFDVEFEEEDAPATDAPAKPAEEFAPGEEDEEGSFGYGWGYEEALDNPEEIEDEEVFDEDEEYVKGPKKPAGDADEEDDEEY